MNGLTIYKSSAGSGKTFTLVKEYLKIILVNPSEYRNILAITFTNKAAAEMKSRIISELAALSEGKNSGMRSEIVNDFNEAQIKLSDASITSNAEIALSHILHDYSSFGISTIDSFFYKVIRSVAREMQLPPIRDIEMDTERVISEIIDNLFKELGENKHLADWLEKLMLAKLSEDKGWKIEDDLHKIASEILKEQFSFSVKTFSAGEIDSFVSELYAIKSKHENTLKEFGKAGNALMKRLGVTSDDFSYGKSGVGTVFNKLENHPGSFEPNTRILSASGDENNWVSKSSKIREQVLRAAFELRPILNKALQFYEDNLPLYNTTVEVIRNIYIFGITEDLIRNLKRLREEERLMLLPDIPLLLRQLISDQDTPFVFEKFGNTFHHLMIDEFQDTSNLQWENLMPLVHHSLASGNFSMIVGDAKQSIYRWRNGNVELLLNGVKDNLKEYKKIISEKSLSTNFRSKEEIVNFNNQFFSLAKNSITGKLKQIGIDDKSLLDNAYSENEIHQEVVKQKLNGGFVHFSFLENNKPDVNSEPSLTWKEQALSKLLETINSLKNENFSFGDIAILVRKNTDGEEIVRYLFENNITNVISPDSLLLRGSSKIRFLISILSYLDNPENEIAITHVLHYYQKEILKSKDADKHEIFSGFTKNKNSLFNEPLPQEFFHKIPLLRTLPLYEICEHLIQLFKLNSPVDAYAQRFSELIYDFSNKNNSGVRGFIEWWNEHESSDKCSLSNPENPDSITIMTIHKSKGLQFPVVVIPFLDWDLEPETKRKQILWASTDKKPFADYVPLPVQLSSTLADSFFADDYHKEISLSYLDNLNMLYVAFTRPEERLYVFCPDTESQKSNGTAALALEVLSGNKWNVNEVTREFSLGKKIPLKKNSIKEIKSGIAYSEFASGHWQNKITIAPKGKKRMESIPFLNSDTLTAVDFGLLVHDILKDIHTSDDIPKALSILHFEGTIKEEEKEVLKNILLNLISKSDSSILFSKDWLIKTEKELLMPDGSILRPDRVLTKDKKAIVADYKTGIQSDEHTKQVNEYAEALKSMGFAEVRKYLLYIRKNPEDSFLAEVN